MTSSVAQGMADLPHVSLWERVASLAAVVVACGIFLTVGELSIAPPAPEAAVSLVTRPGASAVLLQAIAIAFIASALATVVAGRRRADFGAACAALGLGLLTVRHATSFSLLVHYADDATATQSALAGRFVVESLSWFIVIVAALIAAALTGRWVFGVVAKGAATADTDGRIVDAARAEGVAAAARDATTALTAIGDVPLIGGLVVPSPAGSQTPPLDGLKHTFAAAATGLIMLALLSVAVRYRNVEHGQACFLVGASVFVGTWVASRCFPVRSALWSVVAVLAVAVVAYGWTSVTAAAGGAPAHLPQSPILRILPAQFIAVGTVAAIATFWWQYGHRHRPADAAVSAALSTAKSAVPRVTADRLGPRDTRTTARRPRAKVR
jgi:hypothetical protein